MKQMKQLIPLLLIFFLLTGCSEKAVQKEIFAMDTVMTLTAYGKNAETGLNDSISEINQVEHELDPELEGSMIWQLNHANGTPVEISQFIYDMFSAAKNAYDHSGGALDPTIYPAVKTWGFIDGQYTIPATEMLAELKDAVDFSAVSFWEEDGRYYAQMPADMELSFGAVAKGAMAQWVVGILHDAGVESAVISLGGNVQTLGQKPDGTSWNIAVQDPGNPAEILGILSVGETALVTSGSYQRYFEQDGTTYHHILDPKTLSPADSGLVSVTIVCPDGMMADCLSTALFVLGEDDALDYWHTYGGFEMILVTDDDRVIITNGLESLFTKDSDTYTYQYAT